MKYTRIESFFRMKLQTVTLGQTKDFKFPPIDKTDKNRCAFSSSKMGQANAARDKLYDLRECRLSETDASGFDLSGVIMSKTDVSKTKFVESQFSKAFLQGNYIFKHWLFHLLTLL